MLDSIPSGESGHLVLLEELHHLPFARCGKVIIPLNRSLVMGPGEVKSLQLQVMSSEGRIRGVTDLTRQAMVRFSGKTDGYRVWGILENCSEKSVLMTPKSERCAIEVTVSKLKAPDGSVMDLERKSKTIPLRAISSEVKAELVQEFTTLFSDTLGRCTTHRINDLPFRHAINVKRESKPRLMGPAEEAELLPHVKEMLDEGVISEATEEPLMMPLFPVEKKDGSLKPVLDVRRLNSYVHPEPFAGINKEHAVASVRPFAIGSSLDLKRAYNQIEIDASIRKYFGFMVGGQAYVYNRLPFGYVNSPHEFLRAIHKSITKIRKKTTSQIIIYVDDLIVFNDTEKQHEDDLRTVLQILETDGWRLNPTKTSFLQTDFTYLGMRLRTDTWKPLDEPVRQLKDISPPKDRAEWRRVRGWLNQLNRFIHDGVKVIAALKKSEESKEEDDWRKFISLLEDHMVRCIHPKHSGAFAMGIDASKQGWGACLIQSQSVVCCASGTFESSMQRHTSNELEAEGLLRALEKFKPYIDGKDVTIFTDNASTWSLGNSDNCSAFVKRRLAKVQEYSGQMRYVDGPSNVLPDFLSKMPQLMVHQSSLIELLRKAHEGHYCARKTMDRLRRLGGKAQWKTVKLWVDHCPSCQRFKIPKRRIPCTSQPVKDVRDMWSVDFVGPLDPAEGNTRFLFHGSRLSFQALVDGSVSESGHQNCAALAGEMLCCPGETKGHSDRCSIILHHHPIWDMAKRGGGRAQNDGTTCPSFERNQRTNEPNSNRKNKAHDAWGREKADVATCTKRCHENNQ